MRGYLLQTTSFAYTPRLIPTFGPGAISKLRVVRLQQVLAHYGKIQVLKAKELHRNIMPPCVDVGGRIPRHGLCRQLSHIANHGIELKAVRQVDQ